MRLVGLAVVEHALVLKRVEVGELGKSLCKKRMRSLGTTIFTIWLINMVCLMI